MKNFLTLFILFILTFSATANAFYQKAFKDDDRSYLVNGYLLTDIEKEKYKAVVRLFLMEKENVQERLLQKIFC